MLELLFLQSQQILPLLCSFLQTSVLLFTEQVDAFDHFKKNCQKL